MSALVAIRPATDTAQPSHHTNPPLQAPAPEITESDLMREEHVTDIARAISRNSTAIRNELPFKYESDSPYDPYSRNFNARKWVKAFVGSHWESGAPVSGVSFRNLSVHGFGSDADYQKTVGNVPLQWAGALRNLMSDRRRKVQILEDVDGFIEDGEMLVVLGPPGSGCSTYLKTIAGEMNGIHLGADSELNFRGVSEKSMRKEFRGEASYTAEVDVHFPKLTVGQTLAFAAEARAPRQPPAGLSQRQFATHMRDMVMAMFGITHTVNTQVGNDFIRGVSGGERKRVTIAEVVLSGAPLQCWDNSTRGLDSANAIEFCRNIRISADYFGTTAAVAIYQAPQAAYDLFDKVSLLYQGEQIYFGPTASAKQFFVDMGFECPEQQTSPDFLTSLTSPTERRARPGFEGKVPTTPQEFAAAWRQSEAYARLKDQIKGFNGTHPLKGERYDEFRSARRALQSKHVSHTSPYTLSYGKQVLLCLRRGIWRLVSDPGFTISQLIGNTAVALIVGSMFLNLENSTRTFFSRGSVAFLGILFNAFGSALEMYTLYDQRLIVEKHARYAFYHPSAEAFASMITDLPYKITNAILFNTILYFMTGLRREAGAYFFFLLFGFTTILTMSSFFRAIASMSRTLQQALAPATVLILGLVMFTGFAIPVSYMRGWSAWMRYFNPMSFGFESLMINEFSGRQFSCSVLVPSGPGYESVQPGSQTCQIDGAIPGSATVSGDDYIMTAYQYMPAHKWRNFGILLAFWIGMTAVYILAAEFITAQKSKGEVLVFPRGKIPTQLKSQSNGNDEESKGARLSPAETPNEANTDPTEKPPASVIQRQTAIFSWKDVVYDIKIKKEERRILDHVDGWVKPGTLTALMGVSGAGKTTLLDVLATRVTVGVVTGEMLVDGKQRDASFQRKTGYVQQQDLHLATSTVREAFLFSALLRQPREVSRTEKEAYVDEVLKLLDMTAYADAVVGVPGEGLNVEQRKRLTIGVELAAKPQLLLFFDEPTSGLDSQTSWNILQLLRKLTAHGQAILCTIHQPSAMLFEQFDRLLFLAKGGQTVYFGPVGNASSTLIKYFERNGALKYPAGENPAEWMFSVIGATPGDKATGDWHQIWLKSPERAAVREELDTIKSARLGVQPAEQTGGQQSNYTEFAAPLLTQFSVVTRRVFQQYWRTPSYVLAKTALVTVSGLYIGFTFFRMDTSVRGVINQMLAVFLVLLVFSQMIGQIMPNIVVQRTLYEARERPSKTYSWKVFVLSTTFVEIPWGMLVGTLLFFCWYYPSGFHLNAIPTNQVALRGGMMWLFIQVFMVFMSTFASAIMSAMQSAEMGGEVAGVLFNLCLLFCGALIPGNQLVRFWQFMWRVSPLTYFVEAMLSIGVSGATITWPWVETYGGYLVDSTNSTMCQLCPMSNTDQFLAQLGMNFNNAWRNFGLAWVYVVFNILAAVGIYWLKRVPKNSTREQPTQTTNKEKEAF